MNDIRFTQPLADTSDSPSYVVPVFDVSGNVRSVTIYWSLCPAGVDAAEPTQLLHFTAVAVDAISDSNMAFSIAMDTNEKSPRLSELFSTSSTDLLRFSESDDTFSVVDLAVPPTAEDTSTASTTFNITSELEYLRHLEQQASELRTQIATAKATITNKLRQNRNSLCLKHLLKECDGVFCAARVVAQRICDKMGINIDPAFGYSSWETADADHQRYLGNSNEKSFKSAGIGTHTYLTNELKAHPFFLNDQQKPIIIYVLSAFAGLLGLTSLYLLIRKRCASARTRAERAADREERRNKRAYRRAARRALMRKRLQDLLASLNCFRPVSLKQDKRIEDYEEKRALILQEAFLEQDLDLVEKGQVMEAEIRELRHAHEIVASLVRVDDHGHDHMNRYAINPPPPLAFPYTPASARSRAASSYTLPSYTSEVLPDYTSRYSRDRRLSGSSVSFVPSLSSDRESSTNFTPSSSSESATGRRTPDMASRSENSGSSVLDMSPRPSAETLRTSRPSVDTMSQ